MSARAPVGATNRSDLFTSRTGREEKDVYQPPPGESEPSHDNDSPLQLEHMLGYSGDYKFSLAVSRRDENVYYKGYVTVTDIFMNYLVFCR
jgi:hypothetical protein